MKALAAGAALGLVLLSMVLLVPDAPASAAEAEGEGDVLSAERICATGVTPEVTQAHERLLAPLVREARVTDLVVPFASVDTPNPASRRQVKTGQWATPQARVL